MTVTAYVGREIAHLLWDRNISNKDLAAALGIDPTTLSHKLRGRRPWTLEEVLTTAQFFDATGIVCARPTSTGKEPHHDRTTRDVQPRD